jgi:anti-sigma regulatory factor (Ser/Thr protein kinase)
VRFRAWWVRPQNVSTTHFAHEALLHAGDDGFLEGAMPFVLEGLGAGEPMLLVLSADKIDSIKDELNGDDGEGIVFADLAEVGTNPARIIPAWRRFLDEHSDGDRHVRGIGEPIAQGRAPDEVVECQRHEALLNVAFSDASSFRLLCPYDTDALDGAVIDEAVRSHPFLIENGVRRSSPVYRGLSAIAEPFGDPLPAPPASVQELEFDAESLGNLRQLLTTRAADAGLDARRANDLVLAVNEVATNSVRHGGGSGTLRVWMGTRWLVCEVVDPGRIRDPLAGREQPGAEQDGGRGLWIANQVCDLVQVRTFETHNVVRLHLRRP